VRAVRRVVSSDETWDADAAVVLHLAVETVRRKEAVAPRLLADGDVAGIMHVALEMLECPILRTAKKLFALAETVLLVDVE
jgi:hypothetical protein